MGDLLYNLRIPEKVCEEYVYFVPNNGKYHDPEYQWIMKYRKCDNYCHIYSGEIRFDLYCRPYCNEEKGRVEPNEIIELKKWRDSFVL